MRLLLCLLGCLLQTSWVLAQADSQLPPNLNLHTLNVSDDALTNKYHQVIRDGKGYLWIATDKGLERYDGYNVKRYQFLDSRPGSISASVVSRLMITKEGTLWVASGDQLNRYNPAKDNFTSKVIAPSKAIRHMSKSSDGTLWLAGDGFGLLAVNPDTMEIQTRYLQSPTPLRVSGAGLALDKDKIWLAGAKGLFQFNTQTRQVDQHFEQVAAKNGVDHIVSVLQDSRGMIWVASASGLYQLDPSTGDTQHYSSDYQRPNGIKSRMVTSVFEDRDGHVWVGTDKRGLHVYQPESNDFKHYRSSETNNRFLPVASIPDIYQDDEGTIWLSLSAFGILKFNLHLNKFESLFAVEGDSNSLSSNNILEMHESTDGTIWIATDGAGLNRYNPTSNEVKQYRNNNMDTQSLSSDAVISIAEDSRGNLWLGTWAGGLNYFDVTSETFTRYEREPDLPFTRTLGSNHIFDIQVLNDNELLISCWGYGIQHFNVATGEFQNFSPRKGEQTKSSVLGFDIRSITPDIHENVFWLSGYSGVERLDLNTGKASHIDFSQFGVVTEVYVESKDRLWVASQNGLFEYSPTTHGFRYHKISDYQPSNTIMSIEPDDEGRLWLGTRSGLAVFDKTSYDVEFFDTGDGLTGEQFNFYSHLRTADGTLYFGTVTGLNRFKPESFPRNNTPPELKFTNVYLGQKAITHENSPYLDKALSHTESISLPYDESDIGFEFAALSFVYPQKNLYRYRLQGFDNDWVYAEANKRNVRYTNLPHGDYLFEVEASNNDGVWTPNAKQLQLSIATPWWAVWWIKTLLIIAAIGLIYALTSLRVWHSRRRERQLNLLVASRTTELQAANDEVVTLNQKLEQRVADRTEELSKEVVERRSAQKRLYHLAYHDVLTGLPNRSWLLNRLTKLMEQRQRDSIGVIFLDGDRFKRINDTYGHLVGDELLNAAAMRLKNVLADGQTAIRLGGDEFVVLAEERVTLGSMRLLAQAIIETFNDAFSIRHYMFDFQVSVGVTLCDSHYTQAEECLRDADIAMYEAKKHGRGNYQFFNSTMRERELTQNQLESDLKQAIKAAQLRIDYMPLLATHSKQLCSFEAILSWHHPIHGVLDIEQLFALAEDSGQIYDIGVWLFERICLQFAAWQTHLSEAQLPRIIVPVSAVQLNVGGLVDHFTYIARQRSVKPEHAVLQLPEEALFSGNTATMENLAELQRHGFEIMINHFGSGHGALTHLHELPINQVKLEANLFKRLVESDNNHLYEVTKATTTLCQNLKISVIACGINNPEQWLLAQRLNCSYIQGDYVDQPMQAAEATRYISDQKRQALYDR